MRINKKVSITMAGTLVYVNKLERQGSKTEHGYIQKVSFGISTYVLPNTPRAILRPAKTLRDNAVVSLRAFQAHMERAHDADLPMWRLGDNIVEHINNYVPAQPMDANSQPMDAVKPLAR
eukprot:jgi/Tetstr1/439015/TSEL_027507.t1